MQSQAMGIAGHTSRSGKTGGHRIWNSHPQSSDLSKRSLNEWDNRRERKNKTKISKASARPKQNMVSSRAGERRKQETQLAADTPPSQNHRKYLTRAASAKGRSYAFMSD